MNKTQIQEIVFQAIEMANNIREEDKQIPQSLETELYTDNGHLDSMGLVGFLIDVEELFLDEDVQIALSDEKAMSQRNSPFKSVQTLVDYIENLIKEA